MSATPLFCMPRVRAFFSWLLLLTAFAVPAIAVPPKAPVLQSLDATLAGTLGQNSTARYFRLKWQDNSLDESGFRVEVRFGNSGSFLYIDAVPANTTEYVWYYQFPKDYLIQFRVVAYKFNGAGTELAESGLLETTITEDSATLNAPSNFRVAQVNDGQLRLTWNDNSKGELYYQVFYKKKDAADSTYANLGNLHLFNTKDVVISHNLVESETYVFALRATRRDNGKATDPASAQDSALVLPTSYPDAAVNPAAPSAYKVPRLAVPTELGGEVVDAERLTLRWKDNSFNESYYEIKYRPVGSTTDWLSTSVSSLTVNKNTTSFTITVGPGGSYEWRVRAMSTGSTVTKEMTDFSNTHTIFMGFVRPQGLVATTSGASGIIDLTWQDTSVGETAYDIYARVFDEETTNDEWSYVKSLPADSTRASVSKWVQNSTMTPFTIDTEYEFKVVGSYGNLSQSDDSNIAKAYARHGVTSRLYEPAQVGQPFTYTLTASDTNNRTGWNITGLPAGLTFDAQTGIVSGSPQAAGVFSCPMTITYNSAQATVPLTLRILKALANPTLEQSIPATTVGTDTTFDIPLAGRFADADAEKAVTLRTTKGDIDLLLYPTLTPNAVGNFMAYVDSGAYDGVIFHRMAGLSTGGPPVILQGGAYVPVEAPYYFSSLIKKPSPRNEAGIANVRGTISHAKLGDAPDSATTDFFFNLTDNRSNEYALDIQNEGFTVFGRVPGSGMSVVDAIAALPKGLYRDNNPSGGTDTSLDKRVYVDGAKTTMDQVPMDVTGTTPPADMNISKTVRILSARETPVLRYEVVEAPESSAGILTAAVIDGEILRLTGGKNAGSGNIKLRARDLDGNAVDMTFAVTVVKGHKPPVITRHPVSLALLPGGKGSMTVTATGSNLTYQWRRNGTPISGATAKTLSFTNVQAADTGDIDVQVSNATTTLTSNVARLELRALAAFTTHPEDAVVELGEPLELEAEADGAPVPTWSWLRNGKAVAAQKLPELKVAAATLAEGGTYVARATNLAGKADSNPADVIVVDKTPRPLVSLINKNLVFKAQVSGSNLDYQWRVKKSGSSTAVDVADDSVKISGASTATLTIKSFVLADAGAYTCVVTHQTKPELTAETGPWNAGVVGGPPTYNTFTPDPAYVGIEYDYTLPGGGDDNMTISSFAVSGLPAGLKVDPTTGRIRGKATRLGTFKISVTVKNPAGSKTVANLPFYVLPLPEAVVGSFLGQIGNSAEINGNKGGRIDMTVTDGGLISGKLSMGKDILSFTGKMDQIPGQIRTRGTATVIRKGTTPLEMVFGAVAPSGYSDSGNVTGTLSDGENGVAFVAYRNVYSVAKARLSPYTGRLNVALQPPPAETDDTQAEINKLPRGSGYAVAILDNNGVAKVTGRLADGTTLTSSSFLGGQQQFLIYQPLYKNTGSVVGQLAMTYIPPVTTAEQQLPNRFFVAGELMWTRDAQALATERSYKEGFGPISLAARGMTYLAPASSALVMGMPKVVRNAALDFERGGLDQAYVNPDLPSISIGRNSKGVHVMTVPAGETNSGGVGISIAADTGLFSGSFKLTDPGNVVRTATYYGVIIPEIPTRSFSDGSALIGSDASGFGHFALAQLPSAGPPATTIKTSALLSGKVTLKSMPITITQQPVSQTVNPGTNVTFSVTASSSSSSYNYQWRKNGTAISNATSATYNITNVSEGHEGKYDVVVRTPYSTQVSEVAQLTVNDLVGDPVITRTPTANPVLSGNSVTFTATVKGSGQLTYRWIKDNSDIMTPGADGPTFTIPSVSMDSVGNYKVRVSSALSPQGVTSSVGNDLTVASQISEVVLQRAPSSTTVGIGGTVTFTPTVMGSVGPYEYQWYRNGDVIANATSVTYVIDRANIEHVGTYKVRVKNAITPDGVMSNEVALAVSTEVSNVNISRNPSGQVLPVNTAVIFNSSAQGAGPLSYQWKKNNVPINGANQASYSIPSASVTDGGNYTLVVSNATTPEGVESNVVVLEVQSPITQITITLEPNRSSFTVGDNVVMTAVPNAPGPYEEIQWYKNEEVIPNATEQTLTLNGMADADSGHYRVELKNAANTSRVSSSPVSIQVSPP